MRNNIIAFTQCVVVFVPVRLARCPRAARRPHPRARGRKRATRTEPEGTADRPYARHTHIYGMWKWKIS